MSLKDIIERFTLVSGMEMKDVSRYLPIIEDCKAYIESRVKGDLSGADILRAGHACAVYAFYRISMIDGLQELSSFKVGDVQMQISQLRDNAEKLWETEREAVSDILELGSDFAFRSVRV